MIALLLLLADLDGDIEALRRRTAELEPRASILQQSYLQAEAFDREASIKQRVAQGEVLYLLGDYARASVLLFDIVTDTRNTTSPEYDRALYYLGESSFQARNIIGARRAFRDLITRKSDPHLYEAVERLLQIAERLEEYNGVDEQVATLRPLRADVAYIYGKSLGRRGRAEEALKELATVPADHKFYFRARYVIGAEHAKAERWDEALVCFAEITAAEHPLGLGATKEEERNLRELAALAKARIWAERGDVDKAMTHYATISKESPYLNEALYEIAWMSVQTKTFRQALQAIDILLLAQNDKVLAPRAQLLKGQVLLKLGRISDAIDAFNRTGEIYEPVFKELTQTLSAQKDPERYFNDVITKNQGTYNAAAFLPPLAVSWVSDAREVGRAVGVANDLLASRKDVDDSKMIGDRVLKTLAAKPAVEVFPLVAEGERRATDLERDLRRALEELLALQRKAAGELDPATKSALAKAAEERLKADLELLNAKARRQNISADETRRRAAVALLEQDTLRLRSEQNTAQARLIALQRFLDSPDTKFGDKATLREQANTEARVVLELERLLLELERDLVRERVAFLKPPALDRTRDNYDRALAKEIALLPSTEKLTILRDRLGSVDAGLRTFRERLQTAVERRALEIASRVETELRLIEVYERELSLVESGSKSLVGGIAHRSFEDVRKKLYGVVLEADVGLIDVAWKEKDERTQTINELVREQKDSVQTLDRDFDEIFDRKRP